MFSLKSKMGFYACIFIFESTTNIYVDDVLKIARIVCNSHVFSYLICLWEIGLLLHLSKSAIQFCQSVQKHFFGRMKINCRKEFRPENTFRKSSFMDYFCFHIILVFFFFFHIFWKKLKSFYTFFVYI